MKTRKQIEQRKLEIRNLLTGSEDVDVDALEQELTELDAELAKIEKREKLAKGLEAGVIGGEEPETRAANKPGFTELMNREVRSITIATGTGNSVITSDIGVSTDVIGLPENASCILDFICIFLSSSSVAPDFLAALISSLCFAIFFIPPFSLNVPR